MAWMTRTQEDQLILEATKGDDLAFDQLFHQYLPLVNKWYYSLHFTLQLFDRDDWHQECRMVLVSTLKRYRGRPAGEFGAFFQMNVRNHGYDLKRRQNARKRQAEKDGISLDVDRGAPQIMSLVPDGLAIVMLREQIARVHADLSGFEQEVWHGLTRGDNLAHMAHQFACSETRVRNAINRCRMKLIKVLVGGVGN